MVLGKAKYVYCISGSDAWTRLVLRFPISKAAVVVTSDQRFSEVVGDDRDGWIFSHSSHGGGGGEGDGVMLFTPLLLELEHNLVKCNKAI